MRELRFLVPPTTAYLIWILASYFYGKQFIFYSDDSKLILPLTVFISLPAIGFLISQVTIFSINVFDLFFVRLVSFIKKGETFGTFYFSDASGKDVVAKKIFPFLKNEDISQINSRLWFAENMKLGRDELCKWVEGRWSLVMINLNTIVALIFSWILFSIFNSVGCFSEFFWYLLIIAVVLIFNLARAWKEVRWVETYFFDKFR